LILKRDYEILNHCIQFTEEGKMIALYNPKDFMQVASKKDRGFGFSDDSASSSDEGRSTNHNDEQ